MPSSKEIISMYEFKCQHLSCKFESTSAHGLQCHYNYQHRGKSKNKLQTGKKMRRRAIPISHTILGDGKRLPIDRVTDEVWNNSNSGLDITPPELDVDMGKVGEGFVVTAAENTITSSEQLIDMFLELRMSNSNKKCNDVLSTLKRNASSVVDFLSKFRDMESIKSHHRKKVVQDIEARGFKKEIYVSKEKVRVEYYVRDAVEVIKSQISSTSSDSIITEASVNCSIRSHPMNSDLGHAALKAEQIIKESLKEGIYWRTKKDDGVKSFVSLLQVYSDKSQVNLKPTSFTFYPLHITLLNFTEEERREQITSRRSVVAYLPVEFLPVVEEDESYEVTRYGITSWKKSHSIRRHDKLSCLHECVEKCVEPLSNEALRGIAACTRDRSMLHCHFLLSSYIGDLPECEDMLSVKRNGNTISPCHRCIITKSQLPFNTNEPERSLSDSMELIGRLKNDEEGELFDELKGLSMLPIPPVFYEFPMVGLTPAVDIYAIFTFEPLHALSLGISRMLKECASRMLSDSSRFSSSLLTGNGDKRPFNTIRRTVLRAMNCFLSDVDRSSPGFNLRVDFSRRCSGGTLSGLFTETGLVGMLEGADFNSVDMVSPFLGSIIDRCCDNILIAPVTTVFTKYVELVNFIGRVDCTPGWTQSDLHKLKTDICSFKDVGRSTFGAYQPSGMGTPKWHMLDHLPSDLERTGGLEYLKSDLYEMAHKSVKADYNLTSRRTGTAMAETMAVQGDRTFRNEITESGGGKRGVCRPFPSRVQAVRKDTACLVRYGPSISFLEIERLNRELFLKKRGLEVECNMSRTLKDLAYVAGDDGIQVLTNLLRELLNKNGLNSRNSRVVKLQLPASAYISGYPVATLDHMKNRSNEVFIPKSSLRFSQRAVARRCFYASKVPRLDNVMIEASCDEDVCIEDGYMRIWFAKVLSFLRIHTNLDGGPCENHNRRHCPECKEGSEQELCFVQFYDVLSEEKLPIDGIDKNLGCLRLHWQRHEGTMGSTCSSKQYGLMPIDSIRGLVNIVPADVEMGLLHKSKLRTMCYDKLRSDEKGWASDLFYVNRFCRPPGELYEDDDVDNELKGELNKEYVANHEEL